MDFRPMLAPREVPANTPDYFERLQYPLLLSPKIDGIRGVVMRDAVYSKSMLELPSYQVQTEFDKIPFLDGEFTVGPITAPDVCRRTMSHVTSNDKPGDLVFNVFDWVEPSWKNRPFYLRLEAAANAIRGVPKYNLVEHHEVDDLEGLLLYENKCLEEGYEGIMMRNPVGHYKYGRGTLKEGLIYKLKRFEDTEGVIVGFEEELTNTSPQERDAIGMAKRADLKENKLPAGRVGKFMVSYGEDTIKVSPGNFTKAELKDFFEDTSLFMYKPLKFRFMRYGMKDLPRHARAVSLRAAFDL